MKSTLIIPKQLDAAYVATERDTHMHAHTQIYTHAPSRYSRSSICCPWSLFGDYMTAAAKLYSDSLSSMPPSPSVRPSVRPSIFLPPLVLLQQLCALKATALSRLQAPRSWGLFVTPGTAAVTVCCLLQSVLALIKTSWPAATHHIYSHNDAHAQLRQSALIRWAKNM